MTAVSHLIVLYFLRSLVNCYTLAWAARLLEGRGVVEEVRPGHFGLRLELVTVHYLPSRRSWWGWKRRLEVNAPSRGAR